MIGPRDEPPPVLAVVSTLGADGALAREAVQRFAADHGGIDLVGEAEEFDGTAYYEEEMGAGLIRRFWSLSRLVRADALLELKMAAWQVEQHYVENGKRLLNLDPGLLDHTKVVLASFKAGPQKIYLGRGVWADMVLYYSHGCFSPLQWTFPDFRGEGAHALFFAAARRRYKELLRAAR